MIHLFFAAAVLFGWSIAAYPGAGATAPGEPAIDSSAARMALVSTGDQVTSAPDIQGWDPARWGMTEPEVLAAFKGKAQRARKPRVVDGTAFNVTVSGITFATLKGNLEFGFSQDDGRLRTVSFTPDKEYWDDFEILERHLIAAYGPRPRKQDPPGSVPLTTIVSWSLPSSSIVLWQAGSREPGRRLQGWVILKYTAAAVPPR